MKAWAISAVVIFLLSACADDTPGDLRPSVAVVYGTVLDQNGAPVPGTSIRVYLSEPDACEAGERTSADGSAEADIDGRYSAEVKYINVGEAVLCAVAVAMPNAGSVLQGDTASGVSLTVRHESRVPPMDSARVDFVLTGGE